MKNTISIALYAYTSLSFAQMFVPGTTAPGNQAGTMPAPEAPSTAPTPGTILPASSTAKTIRTDVENRSPGAMQDNPPMMYERRQ